MSRATLVQSLTLRQPPRLGVEVSGSYLNGLEWEFMRIRPNVFIYSGDFYAISEQNVYYILYVPACTSYVVRVHAFSSKHGQSNLSNADNPC